MLDRLKRVVSPHPGRRHAKETMEATSGHYTPDNAVTSEANRLAYTAIIYSVLSNALDRSYILTWPVFERDVYMLGLAVHLIDAREWGDRVWEVLDNMYYRHRDGEKLYRLARAFLRSEGVLPECVPSNLKDLYKMVKTGDRQCIEEALDRLELYIHEASITG